MGPATNTPLGSAPSGSSFGGGSGVAGYAQLAQGAGALAGGKNNVTGSTLAGAGAGAAMGATYGSIVPGVGNVVGAAVGAVVGAVGGFFSEQTTDRVWQRNRDQILNEFKSK